MAEMLQQVSDDQLALAVCFTAVATCGLIMYFSHHVGRLTGHIRMHQPEGHLAVDVLVASRPTVVSGTLHDKAA